MTRNLRRINLLTFGPWDSRGNWEAEGYSEFIELDFDTEVFVSNVIVGMPRGMGSVVGIKAWDNHTHAWQSMYEGEADPDFERYMQLTRQYHDFEPSPLCTTLFKTRRVRIELDTITISDWNEIDYVQLIGTTTKQASAIRVMGGGVDFVYVPDRDFAGVDSFTYSFCDCGDKRCNYDVTAEILVEALNDAPVVPEDVTVVESRCEPGKVYSLPLPGTDPDLNETLTYVVTSLPQSSFVVYVRGDGLQEVTEVPFVVKNETLAYTFVGDSGAHEGAASRATINYTITDSQGASSQQGRLLLVCAGVKCPAGSYYDGSECTYCPPGTFASEPGVRTACDWCEPGDYQPERGATNCLACGLSAYSMSPRGAARCTCLPGSSISGATCSLCEPGYFSTTVDSLACELCTPGSFPTDDEDDTDGAGVTFGAKACNPCPRNTFSLDPSTALCAPCSIPRTSEPGSTSCDGCDKYAYLDPFEHGYDNQCKSCPEHVSCVTGTTLATWDLTSGFWRKNPESKLIYECPPLSKCIGGVGRTGVDDTVCGDHFVGRLCSICDNGFYVTATGCHRCTTATNEYVAIVTILFFVIIIAFLMFISTQPEFIVELQHIRETVRRRLSRPHLSKLHRSRSTIASSGENEQSENEDDKKERETKHPLAVVPFDSHCSNGKETRFNCEDDDERYARIAAAAADDERRVRFDDDVPITDSQRRRKSEMAQNSVTLMRMYSMLSVKWKIIISAMQILASNSKSFLIDWPPILSQVLASFSILNVDVLFLPQLVCVRRLNHYDRLLGSTAFPLLLIAGCVVFIITPLEAISRTPFCHYRRKHSKLALAIIILFFAYSSASQVIALTFVCQRFDEEGASYLRADLSIRCSGFRYRCWFAFALCMTFVWPLGMPTLFFCLCWRERNRIDPLQLTKRDVTVSPDVKNETVGKAVAQRQFDPNIHAIKVLWLPYEPEFWYWESIVSAQRMMLTFVASLVKPGTPVQPIFCICVAIVFLRLQAFYNPYCHDQDDVLAEALAWMLIFFYIQALLHMLGKVDGVTMDVLLCSSIGLAIVGTIFLLVTDIHRELKFIRIIKSFWRAFRQKVDDISTSRMTNRVSHSNFLDVAGTTAHTIRRASWEGEDFLRSFAEAQAGNATRIVFTEPSEICGESHHGPSDEHFEAKHEEDSPDLASNGQSVEETSGSCESPPLSPTSVSPFLNHLRPYEDRRQNDL